MSRRTRRRTDASSSNAPAQWLPNTPLSRHPIEIQKELFLYKKFTGKVLVERKVRRDEFEDYGIPYLFDYLGWEGLFELGGASIYQVDVIEWMATLRKATGPTPNDFQLTGTVNGRDVTMNAHLLRQMFSMDTGVGNRDDTQYGYEYKTEAQLAFTDKTWTNEWVEQICEVFGLHTDAAASYTVYNRKDLCPRAKVLLKMVVNNVVPRDSDLSKVRHREITIVHALLTGKPRISLAWTIMNDIWAMYDSRERTVIPHGWLISTFLERMGAILPGALTEKNSGIAISPSLFPTLIFRETDEGFEIYDKETQQSYVEEYTEDELRERAEKTTHEAGTAQQGPRRGASTSGSRGQDTGDIGQVLRRLDELIINNGEFREDVTQRLDDMSGRLTHVHERVDYLYDRVDQIYEGQRATAYQNAYYQQQNWAYYEGVRHHEDSQAGMPYQSYEEYTMPQYQTYDPTRDTYQRYPAHGRQDLPDQVPNHLYPPPPQNPNDQGQYGNFFNSVFGPPYPYQ